MRDAVIPTIREVQEAVLATCGGTLLDMKSQRRDRPTARLRQIAMWLCRHTTYHSLNEIGRGFGGRDHTTVAHAIQKIGGMAAESPELAAELAALVIRLQRGDYGDSVRNRRAMMRLVA